jgi:hypothetical protein
MQKTPKNSAIRGFTAACILLASIQSVLAVEIVSFEQIKEQFKRTKDETRITYLLNRCAALQLNVSALMLKSGKEEVSNQYRKSAQLYMQLAAAIDETTDKKRGVKKSDPSKNVQISVTNMASLYSQKLNDNYAKSGDYIVGDKQIKNELEDCTDHEKFVQSIVGD